MKCWMDSIMSVNKEVNPQHKFALLPFPGKSKLCSLISWIGKKKAFTRLINTTRVRGDTWQE